MIHGSFQTMFHYVLTHGVSEESRYGRMIESRAPVSVAFHAGSMVSRPRINYGIGWIEALQLIGGIFEPEDIKRVAPRARHELFTAQMAYGPRIKDQMIPLLEKLETDPQTRQAILFIGKPEDGPTENQPCTSVIQFLRRTDPVTMVPRLRMYVGMRSWDLVKGMAYDVMMFGALSLAVSRCLGDRPGLITVTAGSAHIYEVETALVPGKDGPTFMMCPSLPINWPELALICRKQSAALVQGEVPPAFEIIN